MNTSTPFKIFYTLENVIAYTVDICKQRIKEWRNNNDLEFTATYFIFCKSNPHDFKFPIIVKKIDHRNQICYIKEVVVESSPQNSFGDI